MPSCQTPAPRTPRLDTHASRICPDWRRPRATALRFVSLHVGEALHVRRFQLFQTERELTVALPQDFEAEGHTDWWDTNLVSGDAVLNLHRGPRYFRRLHFRI